MAHPREMGVILPLTAEREIRHTLDPDISKRLTQQPVANTLGIDPIKEYIATARKVMVNAKAMGPDGLPVELLNSDSDKIGPFFIGAPPTYHPHLARRESPTAIERRDRHRTPQERRQDGVRKLP